MVRPPYFCEHCERTFSDPSNLQRHIRTAHIGARSHACTECGKTFATSSGLKQHQHIHSSVKPFQCEVCLRAYTQFSNLCRHKRMHADCRRQIRCKDCGQNFSTATSLGKHRRFCAGSNAVPCTDLSPNHLLPSELKDATSTLLNVKAEPRLYSNSKLVTSSPDDANSKELGSRVVASPPMGDAKPSFLAPPSNSSLFSDWAPIIASVSPTFFDSGYPRIHPATVPAMPMYGIRDGGFPTAPNTALYPPTAFPLLTHGGLYGPSIYRYAEHLLAVRSKEFDKYQQTKNELTRGGVWTGNSKKVKDKADKVNNNDLDLGCGDEETDSTRWEEGEEDIDVDDDGEEGSLSHQESVSHCSEDAGDGAAEAGQDDVSSKTVSTPSKALNLSPEGDTPAEKKTLVSPGSRCTNKDTSTANDVIKSDCESEADECQPLDLSTRSSKQAVSSPPPRSSLMPVTKPVTAYEDKAKVTLHDILVAPSIYRRHVTSPHHAIGGEGDAWMIGSKEKQYRRYKTAMATGTRRHKDTGSRMGMGGGGDGPAVGLGTGRERYKCRFCAKLFPRSANLTRHLRTHTGEQPYRCSHCDRSFSISSNLQRHVRNIHRREKPFQCRHCSRTFGQQTNLDRHLRRHINDDGSLRHRPLSAGVGISSPSSEETLGDLSHSPGGDTEIDVDDVSVTSELSMESDTEMDEDEDEEEEDGQDAGFADDLVKCHVTTALPISAQLSRLHQQRKTLTPSRVCNSGRPLDSDLCDVSDDEVKALTSRLNNRRC